MTTSVLVCVNHIDWLNYVSFVFLNANTRRWPLRSKMNMMYVTV